MFTTVAFSESQDEAGVMSKMSACADQHVRTAGDKITVPELNQLIAVLGCMGANGDEARLVSPSLRRVNPYYITPIELGLVTSLMPRFMYHSENPIPLDVNEDLEAENDGNPAAAEQHSVVVWLADGVQAVQTGEIFTVNAHVTVTLVAGSWEFSEITFPDSLPVADYMVVGARCVCAAGVAFRFVPVGAAHRPGGVCAIAANATDPDFQRLGRLGSWFNFNTVQPPGVEVLGSAAAGSATYEIYLDLIKS